MVAMVMGTDIVKEEVSRHRFCQIKKLEDQKHITRNKLIVEKIVTGKLEKYYSDTCLVDQVFVKDPEQKQKIKDLVIEKIAKLGENIIIKRFARFQLGEKVS